MRSIAFLLSAIALFAGCHREPPATPTDDPCQLLSLQQVNSAGPIQYTEPRKQDPDERGAQMCVFPEARADNGAIVTYFLTGGPEQIAKYKLLPDIAPVADIGDEAFWSPSRTELVLRKGQRLVVLTGIPRKEWAEVLGKKAVRRMP